MRNRVYRTSSFKLALFYAGMTGVSFVVLFGVILWSTTHFMRHQIDDSVANEINEVSADPQAKDPLGLAAVVRGLSVHAGGFYYLVQDRGGHVLAGNMRALEPRIGVFECTISSDGARARSVALRGKGVAIGSNYLFVGWSAHQLHEMEEMVFRAFLWGLIASVTVALLGGIYAAHRITRKIESVSATTREIVAGDLSRRVPVEASGDEIDSLAASINSMLERIQTLMSELQQVTNDIAHDLRTPLTRLRQRLEIAQRPDAGREELCDTVVYTVTEIDNILGIFSALLRIAQVESGARRAAFDRIDLRELLGTVAELYRPSAEERRQLFHLNATEPFMVRGDRELLLQMFANLVENALKHSPSGSKISLSASELAGRIATVVADDGPGIPTHMRTKALQRFVRLESSRTTSGSGLGLSLAHAIAKLHDASMVLSDNEPGLKVTVSLPNLGS